MLKRLSISLVFAITFIALGSTISNAQSAPVSGKIELKKADGTVVPVEGALVEVFRTDIKSSGPADKTDKKGQFSFAGLQLGATFVISVSAPGAAPTYQPNIKPGMDNLKLTLSEGDGRRLTPDEVRQAVAQGATQGGGQTELTAEQKKAQAEYEKQKAEVESKNAKIVEETKIIEASLKDGNAAFTAKDWNLAISKYDEGINANPTFAGSAPILMNNKGTALRQRAVETYNKNVKSTDQAVKIEAMGKVKADLSASVDTFNASWGILKAAQPTDFSDPKLKQDQIATALNGAKESFRMMAKTDQADPAKIEIAKTMIPEYIAIEVDTLKKGDAQTVLGDVYRVTADFDNAIVEYRKAIEIAKDSPDALAGLGLSLVNVGIIAKDEGDRTKSKPLSDKGLQQMQEGLNFLGVFTQVAPDTHPLKASVKETTDYLSAQSLTPQKVAPARKRP